MVSIVGARVIAAIVSAALLLVAILVVLAALVWHFQEKIAFQPQRAPFPDAAGIPRVDYVAADGQPLFGYLIGEPKAGKGLLLVFHGNADLAIRQVEWAQEISRRTGFAVMLAEYRGYMGLPGHPTYEASRLDAEAAWEFITGSLQVEPDRIAYFGHSLGTAIATELAMNHRPSALVLQSPFTSARDMAGLMIGRVAASAIWGSVSRLYFDTVAKVALLDTPVSVAHGGRDAVIPSWMGQRVFDSAKVQGEWLVVPEGSHSDVQIRCGDDYWKWITDALEHPARGG